MHIYVSAEAPEHPSRGWESLVGAHLRIEPIGGGHTSIIQEPHVQRLASAISQALLNPEPHVVEVVDPSSTAAVVLQAGRRDLPPVICFPGAGANVASFMSLAHALGDDTAVYGLQARGLDGTQMPHTTIEAAARFHCDTILRTWVKGPYRLIGHSFGGWLAFETACLLQAAGAEVASIALLDTEVPAPSAIRRSRFGRLQVLTKLIDVIEQGSGRSLSLTAAELQALSYDAQLSLLLQSMIASGVLPRRSTVATIRGIVRLFGVNLNTSYTPTLRFDGDIAVIRAAESKELTEETLNGSANEVPSAIVFWEGHASRVLSFDAPGDHMTMLSRTYAATLAAYLRSVWDGSSEPEPCGVVTAAPDHQHQGKAAVQLERTYE